MAGARKFKIILPTIIVIAIASWLGRDWLMAKAYRVTLDSEWRLAQLKIPEVVAALELEAGDKIADIGAGTGIFVWPFARAVAPDGIVYAVDVNRHLLAHIDRQAEKQGLPNVQTILGAYEDPLLPESVDLVFLCDTLHHIQSRQAYLETLATYLRPGGRVAVIDFEGGSPHLDPDLRYELQELAGWMATAGFELDRRFDFVEENFFVVYAIAAE